MIDVKVFTIDLDMDIDAVINQDVRELSRLNQVNIDAAIEASKSADIVRDSKKRHDDKIEALLQHICAELLDATRRETSIGIDRLLIMAAPAITNASGLMLRMKHYLAAKGSQYRLVKRKIGKVTNYSLVEFNGPDQS